jgi:hypothetical protein
VSTILKALQRLEDEKVAEVERSLDERIVARRSSPRAAHHLGLAIAVAAISGVAVAVAAFLLWPGQGEPDARVAQPLPPVAQAPAPAVAAAPAPAAAAEPPHAEPAPVPAAPESAQPSKVQVADVVEVVERLDAQPADSDKAAASAEQAEPLVVTRSATTRPAARAPEAAVARKPEAAPEVDAQAEPELEVTVESPPRPAAAYVRSAPPPPVKRAAPAPKPSAPQPAPKPKPAASAAPLAIAAAAPQPDEVRPSEQKVIPRAKVPALTIEKTIWHPDAGRRLAIVKLMDSEEPLRLKEGDAIGPLVVESIKPSSVVFDHDGIEVTYSVGD